MKGTQNQDGTYTLTDGTVLSAEDYQAQLTTEDTNNQPDGDPNSRPGSGPRISLSELQNIALQEENRRLKEIVERNNPPKEPEPLPNFTEGEVFNNPNKLVGVIKKMLDDQVKPLHDFMGSFKKDQAYGALKNKVRSAFPAFSKIENLVDQFMEGKEPTEANLQAEIQRAIGAMVTSDPTFLNNTQDPKPTAPTPKPTPKPVDSNVTTPPHLRPSAPINHSPSNNGEVDMTQFDENAKRLMRENGMGPNEWVLLRDTPADQLTTKSFAAKRVEAKKKDGKAA